MEVVNFTPDDTMDYVNEMMLSTIDNEEKSFKEMLKQPDEADFI